MRFSSFLRLFGEGWPQRKSERKQRRPRRERKPRLQVEELERRELLSTLPAPTVVKVTPLDGTITNNGQPPIVIQFSEAMWQADVTNTNNYLLFNSQGQQVSINNAAYDPVHDQVTLTYNGSAPLTPDRYSLFVRGDQLHDLDNGAQGLAVAGPGQLVVASSGNKTVSLVNMPGDGTLQALSNYQDTTGKSQPEATAIADVTGDGLPDLVVANQGNNTLEIYQGLDPSVGGGFATTPLATINLPKGANPTDVLVADLTGSGANDIVVVDSGTNQVSVFLNNGLGVFGGGQTYAAGNDPIAVVAADFTGSGHQDLAVVDARTDANGHYDVAILPGTGKGTFLSPVFFNTGLGQSTGLAVGNLNSDAKPDLAVSALNGAETLINNSGGVGQVSFAPGQTLTNVPATSVAVGNLNNDANQDIVITSNANSGELVVFLNAGNGTFSSGTSITGVGANPISVAVGDVNGDGANDLLFLNAPVTGQSTLGVLTNVNNSATFGNLATYNVDSGAVSLGLHVNGSNVVDSVATANATAGDVSYLRGNGNGKFLVSSDFSVNSSSMVSVVSGDLNGDGLPDFVIANRATNTVTVLIQQSGGTFKTSVYNIGNQPDSVALGNFTGGKNQLDIAVADYADNAIQILANDGTGNFTAGAEIAVGKGPMQIAVGDFNNDGNLDLAVAHDLVGSPTSADHGVTILLGKGNRLFQAPKEFAGGAFADALVAAHFGTDKNLDLAIVDNQSAGQVLLLQGDGKGNFAVVAAAAAGENPNSIAVGDLNRDGLLDVVVTNQSASSQVNGTFAATDYITVLLGSATGGFNAGIRTNVETVTASSAANLARLQSVAVVSLQDSLFPGVVASLTGGVNDIVTLQGDGSGSFVSTHFYATDGGGIGVPPGVLNVVSDPFLRLTSFQVQGNIVTSNLVLNPSFEGSDLTGDPGNLDGWTSFAELDSHGKFVAQGSATDSSLSPYDEIPVASPANGRFAAMLDEPDLTLRTSAYYTVYGLGLSPYYTLPEQPSDYDGAHALYQDILIPKSSSKVTLTFNLYWDNTQTPRATPTNTGDVGAGGFTDPNEIDPQTGKPVGLDYFPNRPHRPDNQQIRIDLVDPSVIGTDPLSLNSTTTGQSNILQEIWHTDMTTAKTSGKYVTITADVSQFAGKLVRLRVADVNNLGRLIVGVDNVQLTATFNATQGPNISGLRMRNPGLNNHTTDPTFVGTLSDPGSFNNINKTTALLIAIGGNFNIPGSVVKVPLTTQNFDALGNFQFTLTAQTLNLPGPYTIGVEGVDNAGLVSAERTISFTYQGPSTNFWQAMGPGPIDYSDQGTGYKTVAGDITSIAVDPRDPSGNTFYVGTDNGGVWKTTDGGANYTPLTDYVFDPTVGAVQVPIAGVAIDPNHPNTVYAATGIANNAPDSQPGVGILKSTDAGADWTLIGHSVFAGARISKIIASNADGILVGVASGGQFGPGVYQSLDGGQTWKNLMNIGNLIQDNGQAFGNGTTVASVTDIEVSYNQQDIWVGLGNIGLTPTATAGATAGVWRGTIDPTTQQLIGGQWFQVVGGHDPKGAIARDTIPSGANVQRVTIGLANTSRPSDRDIVYVLMNDATIQPGPGGVAQLYKSSNLGLSWTNVLLKEWVPDTNNKHRFNQIDLLGGQGGLDPNNSEANAVGALAVDPANPNVVYIGGSIRYANPGWRANSDNPPPHSFIRVDTSDMRDTNYVDPWNGQIPNDGDDIIKAEYAESLNSPPGPGGKYPDGAAYGGYPGTFTRQEGVYWQDLTTNTNELSDGVISGGAESDQRLPSAINVLVFDPQGRLLIGTVGGMFRGTDRGFKYDIVSGDPGFGFGVMSIPEFGFPMQKELGMDITDINGNLAITDQTSVAVDPLNPNLLDSSQLNVGYARTNANIGGVLIWTSTNVNIITPVIPGTDPFPEAAFNGGTIAIGPADPTSTTGQSTVYRVHSFSPDYFVVYGNSNGTSQVVPQDIEISNDSGAPDPAGFSSTTIPPSWGSAELNNDINQSLPGALFLPFAVKSSIYVDARGNNQDELLFGNTEVWLSDTKNVIGGAETPLWSQISGNLGDVITALAIAPTANHVFWAGTKGGHVWMETPGNPFVDVTNNLPTATTAEQIDKIVVDPRDKTGQTAYITLDGLATGLGHVFMTTNGGKTWANITGNLADVPVYSMAVNPQATLTAPQGTLYVGNAVGVFFSVDMGKTWNRLGQGLPNVPVRDIEYSPDQQRLVVATQGRGTWVLSTRVLGPQVISMGPGTPTTPPFTDVTVVFDEAVDPRSFTPQNEVNARGLVVSGLDHLGSYFSGLVTGFYNQILHRAPTATELSGWVSQLTTGKATDESVIDSLVGGSEYFQHRAASSNAVWADRVYFDILGRGPTPAESSALLNLLAQTGATRASVALTLLKGSEYQTNVTNALYQKVLHRLPTSLELMNALSNFGNGATDESLLTSLVSSLEYYEKQGGVTAVMPPVFTPTTTAFADMNGDGILDKIVLNTVTEHVNIFLGLSAGGFATKPALSLALATGSAPTALVVADLDGDGDMDIAVANTGLDTKSVSVFFNTTTTPGQMTFAPRADFDAGSNPVGIVAADLNGDGKMDLAVADHGLDAVGTNYNIVLLQGGIDPITGQYTFTQGAVITVGDNTPSGLQKPTGLAMLDLNGDGKMDLVVAGANGSMVLDNQSTPATFKFAAAPLATNPAPSAVQLADVNGDGRLDLIVANSGNDTVDVFTGNATGGFNATPTVLFLPQGAAPTALVVGDFNGDGKADIAVANGGIAGDPKDTNNTFVNSVTVFLNNGTAGGAVSFAPGASYYGGTNPIAMVSGDFLNEGITDLAVLDGAPDAQGHFDITFLYGIGAGNQGAGTFPVANTVVVNTGLAAAPTGMAIGDLNHDGLPDLALSGPGGVVVLLNDGAEFVTSTPVLVAAKDQFGNPVTTTSVAIGRLDTSLAPDIVATTTNVNPNKNATGIYDLLVFQNQGNGTFPNPPTLLTNVGTNPTGVQIQDLNGNGLGDVLFVNDTANSSNQSSVTVLKNTTVKATNGQPDTITFGTPVNYLTGGNPVALALGDINGDGVPDLVTANASTNDVWQMNGFNDGSFQTPTDQVWINRAYLDVLGRAPTTTEFSKALATLAANEQARLIGPRGTTVPLAITDVNPFGANAHETYDLTFAPQVADGAYSLVIGPRIIDLPGNQMDQNGNLINGELPADQFNGALAISSSDDAQFISGLFHDLLNRQADTKWFLSLLGPVDAARNALLNAQVLTFLKTTQYRTNLVTGWLNKYLSGDQSNFTTYFNMLQSGKTDEAVIASILGSSAYFQNHGSNNTSWVQAVYHDLFGVAPTTAQLNTALGQLKSGQSLTAVAKGLLTGTRYRTLYIKTEYQALLGRQPTATELTQQLNNFALGTTDERFLAGLLSTSQYFFRTGDTLTAWLNSLYTRLGLTPNLQTDLTNLLSGFVKARNTAAMAILTSTEYRTDLIQRDFLQFLRRPATASDVAFFLNQFATVKGYTDQQIIAALVGSYNGNEYFQNPNLGGGLNDQWLNQVYNDLVGRAWNPNASGAEGNYLNQLNNGTITRTQIALNIMATTEYQTNLLNNPSTGFFETFLHRPANQANGELQFYLNQMAGNPAKKIAPFTNEQIIAELLSSDEYFQLSHPYP